MYVQYIVNDHWPLANDKRAHISKKYIESDRWTLVSTSTPFMLFTLFIRIKIASNNNEKFYVIPSFAFVPFASDVRRPVVVDQTFYNNCRLQNFTQIPYACVGHLISYHATSLLLHENMWNLCAPLDRARCVTKWVNTIGLLFYGFLRPANKTKRNGMKKNSFHAPAIMTDEPNAPSLYVDSHLFIKCVGTIHNTVFVIAIGFQMRVPDDRTHQQFMCSTQRRKAE